MTRPDLLSAPFYKWTYRTAVILSVVAVAACAAFVVAPGWLSASCSATGGPTQEPHVVPMTSPIASPTAAPHDETLMEKIERLNRTLDCHECDVPK